MTLRETEDFLIRISKEEKANSKIADAMSCVLMQQAVFFNVLLMILLTTVYIKVDMSIWGALIGLSIISGTLIFRIKKLKNEYFKDIKKIAKKAKVSLLSCSFFDTFDLLFQEVDIKFITNNLLKKEIGKDIKEKVSEYLLKNKEKLSYNEFQNYFKVMETEKDKDCYIRLKVYFEENKQKLLSNNFKEF